MTKRGFPASGKPCDPDHHPIFLDWILAGHVDRAHKLTSFMRVISHKIPWKVNKGFAFMSLSIAPAFIVKA